MNVLAIHSRVVVGHVGNAAATPGLTGLGVTPWPLDTVRLSNHPGYGAWTGGAHDAADLAGLLDGIAARGALPACDGLLAGYLGRADHAPVAADAIDRVRAANPAASVAVDPVMGDAGPGRYVAREVAEALAARVVPRADVLTPNAFELGWLTGRAVTSLDQARGAVDALDGPTRVLVTSLPGEGDAVAMLATGPEGHWRVHAPRLAFPIAPNGPGDLLAALVLGWVVRGATFPDAVRLGADGVHAVLRATQATGTRELALTPAREALSAPPRSVTMEPA